MNGRLSGARHNNITDTSVANSLDRRKMLRKELLASGYPPGTIPASPQQEYDQLVAMRLSNDPAYWNSVNAQKRLAELALQFGPVPPLPQFAGPPIAGSPRTDAQVTGGQQWDPRLTLRVPIGRTRPRKSIQSSARC